MSKVRRTKGDRFTGRTLDWCQLFVGYGPTAMGVQNLFEETDEYSAAREEDEDKPSCRAAELLGFQSYDHDYVDYEFLKKPLPPVEFFAHEMLQRINDWNIPSCAALAKQCEKLKTGPINFVFHIGPDYLEEMKTGTRATFDRKYFIQYIGAVDRDGFA